MRCKRRVIVFAQTLNESPSEKEGKCTRQRMYPTTGKALNESPSEKEGKYRFNLLLTITSLTPLNESPSEKEGK